MTEAMQQIAGQLQVSSDDAQLLRLANNAVFALPGAGLVIRINRSSGPHARIDKVVRLARWFEQVDAPTIRLLSTVEQPLRLGDLLATVWHYVPLTLEAPAGTDLGLVLRVFHGLTPPPFPLPAWDPVKDARQRLADAEALQDNHRAQLEEWCERLQRQIDGLNQRAESRLIHGDAHAGNLLRAPDGRMLMCDFDSTCLGPWQYDLVAVPVGQLRFKKPGTHRELVEAYGYDVTTDPDWPLLKEVRELKLVVGALPYLASAPRVMQEFELRLRSVEDGDSARWTPYAELRRSGRT